MDAEEIREWLIHYRLLHCNGYLELDMLREFAEHFRSAVGRAASVSAELPYPSECATPIAKSESDALIDETLGRGWQTVKPPSAELVARLRELLTELCDSGDWTVDALIRAWGKQPVRNADEVISQMQGSLRKARSALSSIGIAPRIAATKGKEIAATLSREEKS